MILRSSMIVDDLDIPCVTVLEAKTDAPRLVDRHRPLTFPVAGELVQSDRFQRAQIGQGSGAMQCREQFFRRLDVEPAKLAFSVLGELPRRAIRQGLYH